jgi:hypothetical protein
MHNVPTKQIRVPASSQPLQPLLVPSQVWADIIMDFIEALPKVHGKSVILTVVDRFSKFAHFIPLIHPYTTTSVARAFFNEVVRLHDLHESIMSNRDPVFRCHVWKDLFKASGVGLKMSTTFHPQIDRQSEAVNKSIRMYLRCITRDRPRSWLEWLPWAEYCYNMSYHSSLKTTPFQVVYGRSPPAIPQYHIGSATTDTMDEMLAAREEFLTEVRTRLLQAQDYARKHYNAHHRDLEFKQGGLGLAQVAQSANTQPCSKTSYQTVSEICRPISSARAGGCCCIPPVLAFQCRHS